MCGLATALGTPTPQPAKMKFQHLLFLQVYLYKIVTCLFHTGVGLPGSGQIEICTLSFRPEVWRVRGWFFYQNCLIYCVFHDLLSGSDSLVLSPPHCRDKQAYKVVLNSFAPCVSLGP